MIAKLLLAHLIADFLLQPSALIKWKARNNWGVFWHVVIVFIIGSILLFPYLVRLETWLVLLGISFIHFFQDSCKIAIDRRTKHAYVKHFLVDQLGHTIVVIAAGLLLNKLLSGFVLGEFPLKHLYINDFLFWALSILIIAVPAWDIFLFQFKRKVDPDQKYKRNMGYLFLKTVVVGLIFLFLMWLKYFR